MCLLFILILHVISLLQWLSEDFIGYLNDWKKSVDERRDVADGGRDVMQLSQETLDGLKMTGKPCMHSVCSILITAIVVYSFTELAPKLLSLEGAKFLLSEVFNQDPVEIYFSKQRARCGRGDNPSVKQFLDNAQGLSASKSLTLGNCSNIQKRKIEHNIEELSAPLPKRKKQRSSVQLIQ